MNYFNVGMISGQLYDYKNLTDLFLLTKLP